MWATRRGNHRGIFAGRWWSATAGEGGIGPLPETRKIAGRVRPYYLSIGLQAATRRARRRPGLLQPVRYSPRPVPPTPLGLLPQPAAAENKIGRAGAIAATPALQLARRGASQTALRAAASWLPGLAPQRRQSALWPATLRKARGGLSRRCGGGGQSLAGLAVFGVGVWRCVPCRRSPCFAWVRALRE